MLSKEYLDNPSISASDLKRIFKRGYDEFKAYKEKCLPPEPVSPSLTFGSYFHSLVFNPKEAEREYVEIDPDEMPSSPQQQAFLDYILDGEDTIKAYEMSYSTRNMTEKAVIEKALELRQKLAPYLDKFSLNPFATKIHKKDVKLANEMKKSLMEYGDKMLEKSSNKAPVENFSIFFKIFFNSNSIFEEPLFGKIELTDIKGVPDLYLVENETVYLSDLKTISHSGPNECIKSMQEHQYYLSLQMYLYLIYLKHNLPINKVDNAKVSLMFVSKSPPFNCTEIKLNIKNLNIIFNAIHIYEQIKDERFSMFNIDI